MLVNGTIVTASADSHPELYKALRGGGGNFGIVTSFTLNAYPHPGMWGGPVAWDIIHSDSVIAAFMKAGESAPEDPNAFFILALGKTGGHWHWGSWLSYCDRVESPVFFQDVLAIPSIYSAAKTQSHSEMSRIMARGYPHHVENSLWVSCTNIDEHMICYWGDVWIEEMDKIADVEGLKVQVAIQYITQNVIDRMTVNGGNALGLADKGPFLMFNAEPVWAKKEDNPRVLLTLQTIFDRTEAEAKQRGVYNPYIYLNYASQYQNAFEAFDEKTREFLENTSRIYDPDGLFQDLRGAGFKLKGPPEKRFPASLSDGLTL